MKIRSKAEKRRDTTVNIRVSQSEKDLIKKLASKYGVSVSAYIMNLVYVHRYDADPL